MRTFCSGRVSSSSSRRRARISSTSLGAYFYYQKDHTKGTLAVLPEWIEASPVIGPALAASAVDGEAFNLDTNTHKTWSSALFGQGSYHFTDQWSLTVGMRVTYEKKSREGSQIATLKLDAGPFGPDTYYDEDLDVWNFSPMVVLQYAPTEDSMIFAKFAQGFKSGGFNQQRVPDGVPTQFRRREGDRLRARLSLDMVRPPADPQRDRLLYLLRRLPGTGLQWLVAHRHQCRQPVQLRNRDRYVRGPTRDHDHRGRARLERGRIRRLQKLAVHRRRRVRKPSLERQHLPATCATMHAGPVRGDASTTHPALRPAPTPSSSIQSATSAFSTFQ